MRAHSHRLTLAAAVIGVLAAGSLAPAAAVVAKHKAAKPAVHALSAKAGPSEGGTKITITGTGFSHVKKVEFGTARAKSLKVVSSKKLKVTAPKHAAGKVTVTIVAKAGKSAKTTHAAFTYVAPPSVTHVSPAGGPTSGGTTVTVSGHNFSKVTKVDFGSSGGTSVKLASTSKLTVKTPAHAGGTADVRVITAYGTSPIVAADRYQFAAGVAPATLTWTNAVVPEPAGAEDTALTQLNRISCGAVGFCVAVGSTDTGAGPEFLATLKAGVWTTSSPPVPSDVPSTNYTFPSDVSCVSATSCELVGNYVNATSQVVGMVASYDGANWTATQVPVPAGAAANPQLDLTNVSCASATSCVAVGKYTNSSSAVVGVIETLASGAWTAQPAPMPTDAGTNPVVGFTGVDCPAVGSCAAIGTYLRSNGYHEVLAESSTGGAWTAANPSSPGDSTADPEDVTQALSCSAAGVCAGVGYQNDSEPGLEIVLANGTWKITAAPPSYPSSPLSVLHGVGCLPGGPCVGAGEGGDPKDTALVVTIGGAAIDAPMPADADTVRASQMSPVACTTTLCIAGGHYDTDAGAHTSVVLDQYGAGTWTPTEAPLPAGDVTGNALAISCATPTFCVAVGYVAQGSTNQAGVGLSDIGTA